MVAGLATLRVEEMKEGFAGFVETLLVGFAEVGKRIAVISDQTSLVEGQSVLTNIFILRQGFR